MTGCSPTDQELIRAVIEEVPGASDLFIERFGGFIWSVLVRDEGLPPQDAEDASQKIFLKLIKDDYRRLRNWRGEGNFVSYLGPIVRHLARDYRREEGRQRRLEGRIGAGSPGKGGGSSREVEGAGDGNPGTGHDHGGGLRVPGAGRDVALGRDPESQLIAAEEAARIRRCLERLSSRDRELLERRHSLGQSYREIAAALRMTVVNVGVALGRAEARLRSMIEEDGRPGPRPIRDIPEVNV